MHESLLLLPGVNETTIMHEIFLDPQLKWPLFGIPIVMIFIGILRHYLTIMLQQAPTKPDLKGAREASNLARGQNLRNNGSVIPKDAFLARKAFLTTAYKDGVFLKNPVVKGAPPINPLTDPAGMEQMMGMAKNSIATFIPQTVIMSWINFFFSGFILMKLPFPLTIRFKNMLQSGVATNDLDVRWVSSLSWYFVTLFGLRPVYTLILGDDNAAVDMSSMAAMGVSAPQLNQPGQNVAKIYEAESENIQLAVHDYVLDGIKERMII